MEPGVGYTPGTGNYIFIFINSVHTWWWYSVHSTIWATPPTVPGGRNWNRRRKYGGIGVDNIGGIGGDNIGE